MWTWVRSSRRNAAVAIALAVTLAAAAVVVPLSLSTEGPTKTAAPTGGCDDAGVLGAPPPASAAGAWQKVLLPTVNTCYTLAASRKDAGGVAPDSTFRLTSAEPIDAARLVAVSPPVRLEVKNAGRNSYEIRPASPLERGRVYRFSLLDRPDGRPVRSWAFQVQDTLRIVSTHPDDRATHVPLDTGIEVTFSLDSPTGIEGLFKIAPPTAGRFETHKRTVVFVPRARLKAQTLYTVTIAKGARSGTRTTQEDFVFRFETGTGESQDRVVGPPLRFSRGMWESVVREAPVMGMYIDDVDKAPKSVPFTVYRYAGLDAFLAARRALERLPAWAEATRAAFEPSSSGLAVQTRFSAKPQRFAESADAYVRFPAALPAGFYLVSAGVRAGLVTAWLQVTDVATYTSVSKPRTLAWVNDAAAGVPIAGAGLTVAGERTPAATTGRDGMASFATPASLLSVQPHPYGEEVAAVRDLVVSVPGGRTAVVPLTDALAGDTTLPFRGEVFDGDPNPWWRYLYTDRPLYRPTDTLRFWGLARRRGAKLDAKKLQMHVIPDWSEFEPIARASVTTTRTGTFIGSIPLEALSSGYYTLRALDGEQVVTSASFEVADFVKPAYKIDVVPSRRAVFAGERVLFRIESTFFEGTPVPGVVLNTSGAVESTRVSDSAGRATVEYTAKSSGPFGDLDHQFLGASSSLSEEGDINGGANLLIFRSAVGIEAIAAATGGNGTVSGEAYRIDPQRLNGEKASDFGDYRAGPATGVALTIAVTEVTYRCTAHAERYDFVAKRVQRYCSNYDRVTTPRGSFARTTDDRGRYSASFPAASDRTYEVRVSGRDAAGRTFATETGVYRALDVSGDTTYLEPVTPGPYAVGSAVSLTMRTGSQELPSGGRNRYLFFLAQNGILSHTVQPASTYSFRFEQRHVPNVAVAGVRFTGTAYEEIAYPHAVTFDKERAKLRIAITSDKPRYRPGETARLSVQVTDAAGKPARAEVLVSAIDEAIFRLQSLQYFEQLNILDALYSHVASGLLQAYASHRAPVALSGGEAGGEGGDRVSFKDTGLFERVVTGDDGRASVPFKVPDNLTSWRVGAIGVTESLSAGSGAALVPVGLPVFVDAALNTTYLTTDRPAVRVRAFGTGLKAGDPVRFTVKAPSLDAAARTATGRAFTPVDVPLPPLSQGTHKVSITVEAAERSDTLVREITVVPSRLLRAQSTVAEVAAGASWTPPAGSTRRTSVVLTDHNRGRYLPPLESLAWTSGDRVDQMLARTLAQEMLVKHFRRPAGLPTVFAGTRYQNDEGAITLFPYSGPDLLLSARVADIAPDRFGRARLADYFNTVIDEARTTRERRIAATYGLAALGEPVLADVASLANQDDLSPRERLYAGLAAAAIGDEDAARRVYRDVLQRYGEVRGATARVRVGTDTDDIVEATSLAAILGAALADERAPALFDYASSATTTDLLADLDRISYLAKVLPSVPAEPVRVSYTSAGTRTTTELSDGRSVFLDLSPSDLRALRLTVESGRLGVVATTLAPFDPRAIRADRDVTLSRFYADKQGTPISVDDGEVVRVVLNFSLGAQADDGCYQVSDLLPSGLRPVTRPYARGLEDSGVSYPYAVDGQRVSFCVYKDDKVRVLQYYARVIGTGTFTAEPAVIQSQRAPGGQTVTGSLSVQIR
ncbi:MAG: Ig-like domain-containing protein [Actinomycetota bacterium]